MVWGWDCRELDDGSKRKGRKERYIAMWSLMIFGVVLYSLMNNLTMAWLRYIVEQFRRVTEQHCSAWFRVRCCDAAAADVSFPSCVYSQHALG
jgi:hypothetical protein